MPLPLGEQLPWTKSPLIVNAPMGGFAGGRLAAAVSKAGGLGQIGAVFDMAALEHELALAKTELGDLAPGAAAACTSSSLPIGVGLLPFVLPLATVLPLLQKYRPAVIWLFASSELADYATWTQALREALPASTRVWIQVGSVAAALEVAQSAHPPDALVLQGSDAGGHGFERGASVVSLVPEASDALGEQSPGGGDMPLLAAGGIVDARGAAAALALGASGVVLGTRFLATHEVIVPPAYQSLILSTRDGGQSTVRSKLFDNVKGPNIWPTAYDGRSLVTKSYIEHALDGVPIEDIRDRHNEATISADAGFGSVQGEGRTNVWAGAGVGLVNKVEDAKVIVEEIREGVGEVLRRMSARL